MVGEAVAPIEALFATDAGDDLDDGDALGAALLETRPAVAQQVGAVFIDESQLRLVVGTPRGIVESSNQLIDFGRTWA